MKRTPLKRRTGLRSCRPLRRVSAKKAARDRAYRGVREFVAERAGDLCEAQVVGVCRIYGGHAHHRLRRSQGGPDTAENLAWLCHACHDHVHRNPAWAYTAGLLRRGA
jgi:hypothetical protein